MEHRDKPHGRFGLFSFSMSSKEVRLEKEGEVCQQHTGDNRNAYHPRKNLVIAVAVFSVQSKHTDTLAYMREFKKRQPTGATILRFLAMSMGTLVLFLMSVVVVRAAWGMYDTFKVAVDARDSAEGQLATLKASEARLSAAVSAFETPQGVEHEIRERFGVALPGEGEIQIVRDQGSTTLDAAPKENIFIRTFRSLFVW